MAAPRLSPAQKRLLEQLVHDGGNIVQGKRLRAAATLENLGLVTARSVTVFIARPTAAGRALIAKERR